MYLKIRKSMQIVYVNMHTLLEVINNIMIHHIKLIYAKFKMKTVLKIKNISINKLKIKNKILNNLM